MPVSRRKYNDLLACYERALEKRDKALKDLGVEVEARRSITRQYAEGDNAIKRLYGRNCRLAEQLRLAREAQGNAEHEQMMRRLDRALRACHRYRVQLADARRPRPAPGGAGLARQLELSERARRSLEEQLLSLQASHEAQCRELVTRAGTLAAAVPAGREPGAVTT